MHMSVMQENQYQGKHQHVKRICVAMVAGSNFKCNERVCEEDRSKIFTQYHDLKSDAQNVYLFGCMTVGNPKRVYTEHRSIGTLLFSIL